MIVKLNTGQSIKVKEGTSIIVHVPRVTEGVLYARFYADDGLRLIETQVVNVAEIAPDEAMKPLPVRYRDPDTNAVVAQNEAADAQDAASVVPKHEHETDPDGRQICTTSGDAPSKVRAEQTEATGQHKSYIVLCEDERKKGFVRPYRDAYKHVGRRVCGKPRQLLTSSGIDPTPLPVVCTDEPDHAGDCTVWAPVDSDAAMAKARDRHVLGGCGSVTTMGRALSETYARDFTFYSGTFCVHCNAHFPVGEHGEFVWIERDGSIGPKVGT
jgi:hypothetical protein